MSQTKAQLIDTLVASLLPASDSSVDIGSNAVRFANIYGDTLYGNGANLTGINTDLVSDTTPQLGGDLDVNDFNIKNGTAILDITTNQRFEFGVAGTTVVDINGNGVDFKAGNNTHADNVESRFGTGNDLKIYHDGSNSRIVEGGTGSLVLQTSKLNVLNAAGTESMLTATENGAVELYYDNVLKLRTQSGGVTFEGTDSGGNVSHGRFYYKREDGVVKALYDPNGGKFQLYDSVHASFGNSHDLQIFHNGTDSKITNTTGNLIVTHSDGIIRLDPKTNENGILIRPDGAVELFYDNSKTFHTKQNGVVVEGTEGAGAIFEMRADEGDDNNDYHRLFADGTVSNLYFQNYASGSWETNLRTIGNGTVELWYDNSKKLETKSFGVQVTGELYSDGLRAGDNEKLRLGDGEDLQIYHDGTHSHITNATNDLNISCATSDADLIIKAKKVSLKDLNNDFLLRGETDGEVKLYYDGGKKFETNSTGSTLFCTGNGNNEGPKIEGSSSMPAILNFQADAGSANNDKCRFYGHQGGGSLLLQDFSAGSFQNMAKFNFEGSVELYHDNSAKLTTTSDGVDFGTGGANDILCISGQTIHRTGGNGCGLHFSSSVILPTNAAGTTGDQSCSLGNGSNRFTSLDVMQLQVHDRVGSHLKPYATNTYDLGSTTYRWRNLYTNDLNLSNEGSSNDVDGTWGSYTIQEGANNLFLINKRNGKKYKFNLTEVS